MKKENEKYMYIQMLGKYAERTVGEKKYSL